MTETLRHQRLHQRALAARTLRRFFEERDFLEVDTPSIVASPGLEVHLDAFAVVGGGYLITSPEYHLKRLLSEGLPRLFQLCHCFRQREIGQQHNPEFTMVEWYRAGETYESLMADCEALFAAIAVALRGTTSIARGDRTIELAGPWPRITVRDALRRYAHVDLRGDESLTRLHELARAAGIRTASGDEWDDVFHRIFLERVEPELGREQPTFVTEWPVPLAALARRKPDDPLVVERFELYAGGMELANAFGELTDPVEQRARLVADQETRARRGKPIYPVDEHFLAALERGLVEPTSGIALGFDRLLMLVLEASTIGDVIAFLSEPV